MQATGKQGYSGPPGHREVYDGLALFQAEFLEDTGDARHLAKEFDVGDLAALAQLVYFVDDRSL